MTKPWQSKKKSGCDATTALIHVVKGLFGSHRGTGHFFVPDYKPLIQLVMVKIAFNSDDCNGTESKN